MSRFERLIQNTTEVSESEGPTITTSGRFGSSKIAIATKGPYTQGTYTCVEVPCAQSECESPILYIMEPEYDLEVGVSTSIPAELTFTKLEAKTSKEYLEPWSRHNLATEKVLVVTCPDCGEENKYVSCKDGGLLILTARYKHVDVPIPKNRIRFITTPRSEWSLEDD